MLSLALPGAAYLALALLPVALLYFLRMRYRRREVGSLYIWKSLAGRTTGGKTLRRRSLLLLFLQTAAVILAASSAAAPSLVSRSLSPPGTVFLIDRSASMASVDEEGTARAKVDRITRAAALVREEMTALGPSVPTMAFACGAGIEALGKPGTDRSATLVALSSLRASAEGFAESAVADALSAWLAGREEAWQAVLVTDGGLDLGGRRLAAAFGDAFRVLSVGKSGDAIGATGFRLEGAGIQGSEGNQDAVARFTVWNGAASTRPFIASIERDGTALASARLEAPPGWSRSSLALGGVARSGAYTLSVADAAKAAAGAATLANGAVAAGDGAGGGDASPLSRCYLALYPRRALSVLLAGRRDPFLEAALAHEGIAYTRVSAIPESLPDPPPDLVIADGVPVPSSLTSNLLSFGTIPPDAPLVAAGYASGTIVAADPSHRLSRYVDWGGARIEEGRAYRAKVPGAAGKSGGAGAAAAAVTAPAAAAETIATVGSEALIVAWERGGYRAVVCGVDLARSDLGLSGAFPVFIRNVIEWCFPRTDEQSAYTLVVGEAASRAEPPSFRVKDPGLSFTRSGTQLVLDASKSGFFAWERGSSTGFIAANPPSSELDIAPRRLAIGQGPVRLASTYSEKSRPLGAWPLLLCMVCLIGEWLLWRGPLPPSFARGIAEMLGLVRKPASARKGGLGGRVSGSSRAGGAG